MLWQPMTSEGVYPAFCEGAAKRGQAVIFALTRY
jgi:hypothetical protein